ncbi:MAG TPA: MFS transporter [Alphaproteobacteria bacterium]|nr:MFS transporter [Alphaproteobacteria bacterium]
MRLFPESATADARRLVIARGLRAIGDGFVSILMPAYLLALGQGPFEVGVLTTATLIGSAALTLMTGWITARFGHRRPLLWAAGLMIFTGLGFAGFRAFWPLLVVAFIGTLNPSAGDVSVFYPLEQSLLARSVAPRERTQLFAEYSLAGALMGALGTLLAAVPDLASARLGLSPLTAMQAMFLLYAATGVIASFLYRDLAKDHGEHREAVQPLGRSRGVVYRLTALFTVDSFGGGFLVQSILVLWLFQRFQMPVTEAASLFFWAGTLTATSYLAAAPLARRIGLIRTMVFTHLPSSLCVIAIPFVSDLRVVIGLLLVRALLSQMDVPARSSYVMAVVSEAERPAAASLTAVPRSLASAVSPVIAGYLITLTTFGWPLLFGGVLKAGYDLALLRMFSRVRPPEEAGVAKERA